MAAPTIALRFRDTTPGIDTIAEHRELIARDGRVGWGWWKKTFEPAEILRPIHRFPLHAAI
jgi:hypothetical protein